MMRWIMGLVFSLLASAAFADVTIKMDGCTLADGLTVGTTADASFQWIAEARLENGAPLIRYNPAIAPQLPPEARLFLFAHECARLYLKQPLNAERSAEAVRNADCWALETLRQSNALVDADGIAVLEKALAGNPAVWQPARELKLASCTPAEKKSAGGLGLPQNKVHPDQWNRCVQSCGAVLYKCGRAASCMTNYDACVTSCGQKK